MHGKGVNVDLNPHSWKRAVTSKSGSVSQSSPSVATFMLTLWPTTDFHIWETNTQVKISVINDQHGSDCYISDLCPLFRVYR